MAHQSLYRRYRPARFGEIIGQPHTVAALRNAVAEERVGHAYLFSGPRGTGKTSSARILAKALNCEDLAEGEPCGTCGFCTSIAAGTSYELHELDAASNNKVDDIRDLISRVAIGTPGRTKVYVLDEVHMLTPGAENALLKTLEEPPGHVVFVLCTTEPHKVVQTIRSRTQHLHFELVGADLLERHLRAVATDAGLDVSDDDVRYVLAAGGGSVRDTLSALDAVTAAGRAPEGGDAVAAVLDALVASDTAAALAAADEATRGGQEPRVLGEALLGQLRNAFLASVKVPLEYLSAAERAAAAERARHLTSRTLTSAMELLGAALVGMREAPDPRVDLDLALVRLTGEDSGLSLRSLADRVDRLERGIAGRPPPASAATGSADRPPAAAGSSTGRRPSGGQPPPAGGGPSGPARARQALAGASATPKLCPRAGRRISRRCIRPLRRHACCNRGRGRTTTGRAAGVRHRAFAHPARPGRRPAGIPLAGSGGRTSACFARTPLGDGRTRARTCAAQPGRSGPGLGAGGPARPGQVRPSPSRGRALPSQRRRCPAARLLHGGVSGTLRSLPR